MSENLLERERIKKYSWNELSQVIEAEQLSYDDMTYLTSISTYAAVTDLGKGRTALAGLSSKSILVFLVAQYPTGVYSEPGISPIIVINEDETVLDYDLVSELHTNHDWEIYLWLSEPWEDNDSNLGIHGEWYRSDVYPDGMKPFDGENLGWEDKNNSVEEGDSE